ncbi:MAG: acyl-CoA dehydrogenase family protein [Microthrixaceae bacterium]
MTCAQQVGEWIDEHWSRDLTLARWWDLLFDAGYAFPTWPVGLGGTGASSAEARVVTSVLAERGTIAAPAGNGPNMGAPTLIEHGTADQQRRFVEPLGRGRTQWCQLFSEPGAGSDLASLSARAERDGDTWVVSGQKVWNSKADVSEWGMLLCRTDPDAPKHRGISFMMIDMGQPGVEVRPLLQMNGAAEFSEVFLTEARVHVDDVIGPLGGGWDVARTTLAHERASTSAGAGRGAVLVEAGGIPGNLDRTVGELLRERTDAGGAPRRQAPLLSSRQLVALARGAGVADRPELRDRVVRYYVHSEVHRRNGQRLRDLARARVPTALDGSAMKLDLAQLAHESRDLSLELLGAAGMLAGASAPDGGRVVRTGLSSFVPSLGGGTNEIQRNIIGERTLGLPREPAVDADTPFRATRRT